MPDKRRIAFFRGYVGALARTPKAGVPIRGYSAWSLLGSLEWAEGYSQRFGLTFVDFQTLKCALKQRGKLPAELAAADRLSWCGESLVSPSLGEALNINIVEEELPCNPGYRALFFSC